MTQAEHIAILARQYGITVETRKGAQGMAYHESRRIRIAPVAGPVSYATALHELGHLVAQGASGPQHSRLIKETRAWKWAMWAALEWTDRMDSEMQRSLGVYVDRGKRRGWPIPAEVYRLLDR